MTGVVLLAAVAVGTGLLWGYLRIASGRNVPLAAPAFWALSAAHNGLLLGLDGWAWTDTGGSAWELVLVAAAWHAAVLGLSLVAHRQATAAPLVSASA